MQLTRSEKAHATRVKNCAQLMVSSIQSAGNDPAKVVEVIATIKASPTVKGDAYTLIDRTVRWYGADTRWHSALRACRNDPTHGPALFALFC